MRFCVHCGAARRGAEAFCLACGHPYPAEPPMPPGHNDMVDSPGRWSSGRWSPRLVAAWLVLGLVVAGTTVGVLVARAEHASPTGSPTGGPPGALGGSDSPGPTDDTGGVDIQPTDPGPTDIGTTSDEPTDAGTPTDPNGVVTLSDQAAPDPAAAPVLAAVSQYFLAINTLDYQLYQSLHTADAQANMDPATFQRGYRSTRDSDAVVAAIGIGPDGEPTAEITFTSQQDPADGPDGDTCDEWDITLFLRSAGDNYLIATPPPEYHASHQPC